MKLSLKLISLATLLLMFTGTLKALELSTESIDNIRAEIIDNKLVISFDLNTENKIESLWVEIRKADGTRIFNNPLDEKIWNTVAAVNNSRIIWEYPIDNTELAGQDLLIDVKARVYQKPSATPTPVAVYTPVNNNQKPTKTARFPQFRMGLELNMEPTVWAHNYGSASSTITGEYIVRPNFSILSGLGFGATESEHDIYQPGGYYSQNYYSLLLPLTLEFKLNTGRFFRMYMGGGIINRVVVKADDTYFTFNQGLKRYVLGAKAEAGIELWNMRLGLTYSHDLTPYSVLDEKIAYMGVTLGIRFGGSTAYIK